MRRTRRAARFRSMFQLELFVFLPCRSSLPSTNPNFALRHRHFSQDLLSPWPFVYFPTILSGIARVSTMDGIQLPHDVTGSHDTLRHGLPAFKNEVLAVHPVEVIQRTSKAMQAQTKRTLLERAYGSAFPMKMDIERQILTRFQRPTGLIPSSMLGLESLTGELEEFGFEDFLNDPKDSDTFVPLDLHEGMEVRLGLSKGPVSRSFF